MGIGIQDVFNLIGHAIKRRRSTVSGTIPTVEDLEAEVQNLYASESPEMPINEQEITTTPVLSEKATSIASGCIPCSIGHLGTCSGLLNEAMRFARKDGLESDEVIERVSMCMDELNALERVDLRPEMIHSLPEWEKTLAEAALGLSRILRHELEQLSDVSMLEKISAETQTTRQEIGKAWHKGRLSRMMPEQREIVERELRERAAKAKEA